MSVFSPKKDVPSIAAARIKRWALLLSAYDYHIVYRQSRAHGNADGLSRLRQTGRPPPDEVEGAVFQFSISERAPINAQRVASETRRDPLLSRVYSKVAEGWRHDNEDDDSALSSFKRKRLELSLEGGCLLWGSRVVIPEKLRHSMMEELHTGHQGATKMKILARSYIWWPNIDEHIETLCRSCPSCLVHAKQPETTLVHPWVYIYIYKKHGAASTQTLLSSKARFSWLWWTASASGLRLRSRKTKLLKKPSRSCG